MILIGKLGTKNDGCVGKESLEPIGALSFMEQKVSQNSRHFLSSSMLQTCVVLLLLVGKSDSG
jgi:hypothetical protein